MRATQVLRHRAVRWGLPLLVAGGAIALAVGGQKLDSPVQTGSEPVDLVQPSNLSALDLQLTWPVDVREGLVALPADAAADSVVVPPGAVNVRVDADGATVVFEGVPAADVVAFYELTGPASGYQLQDLNAAAPGNTSEYAGESLLQFVSGDAVGTVRIDSATDVAHVTLA